MEETREEQTSAIPSAFPVVLNNAIGAVPRKTITELPRRFAVVVARRGTLDGTRGIVMADEAMAISFAKGLVEAGRGQVDLAQVVEPGEVNREHHDAVFMFHHVVRAAVPLDCADLPSWLWVHNPGHTSTTELRRAACTTYQRVFHAGEHRARVGRFCHLPHGLEDLEMFRPDRREPIYDIGFVGNATMHHELMMMLLRLHSAGRKLAVRGLGWREIGVPSDGPIAMNDASTVLARSRVCLDHVSYGHRDEGMVSTRLFQCLACEVPVVSTQNPEIIPEEMRRHIIFTPDVDSAVGQIERLLVDSVARARLREGARLTILNHTIHDRAKQVWATIVADISAARNSTKIATT